MAYAGYEFPCTSQATFWSALNAVLVAAGWTLHDDVSATVKVYKSNGEKGSGPYGYLYLYNYASNYIEYFPYAYWDAATHTGYRKAYDSAPTSYQRLTVFTGPVAYIGGDKDSIIACTNNSSVNYQQGMLVCHVPTVVDSDFTTLTENATAGANATLTVADSSKFGVGRYFQIFGLTEGVDRIYVTEKTDSTHIKVANLPRNYASGSFLGFMPLFFGDMRVNGTPFNPVNYHTDAGATVSTNGYVIGTVNTSNAVQNTHDLKYGMTGFQITMTGNITLGYLSSNIYYPYQSFANQDVGILNNDGSMPAASSATLGTSTTLVDTTQSWTTDALIGKFVVITAGTGIGQVRKITDNDATSLTVETWATTPDATSDYKISDRAFRVIGSILSSYKSLHEITHTQTPS